MLETRSLECVPRERLSKPRDANREAGSSKREARSSFSLVHVTTVAGTLGFLKGHIGHLRGRGCDVTVVASPGPELDDFGADAGVRVAGVPMARSITPLADLVSIARLWKLFRDLRPEVVHAHTPKGGLLALIAAALAGVPARFYTVHGLPLETAAGWKRMLLRWTERVSCGLAHRVHPVSESLARLVRRERLCPNRRIFTLPPGTIGGVDAERRFLPGSWSVRQSIALRRRLGIPPLAPVVGFVGRLVRDKGVHDLVDAWNRLRPEWPGAHLIIAGRFETRDPVSAKTTEALKSDSRIHLLGPVNEMPQVYAAMDVLALPTYREGFPQTPLEAAAMEVPVVATRVTGCVDAVIPGVTGALVAPGDPAALKEALAAYLGDPRLRRCHGEAARRRALEEFAPRKFWRAMEGEYRLRLDRKRYRRGLTSRPRALKGRGVELMVKRSLDIAGAGVGLILLLPLLVFIGAVTLLTLGRPIFFRQVRPGLKGRPFTPLKFRTMRPGTEPDAVRVTSFGRFLRRFSLDELPQLWNVLVGEMSLVGPRPLLMRYLRRYTPRLRQRHDVRPGLTGWCQVNGRNSLMWDRKFAHDVWYVEHWSLALDVIILFMTLGKIVRHHEVEGPGSDFWPDDLEFAADMTPTWKRTNE